MYLPSLVFLVTITAINTITPEIQTGSGTPKNQPVPKYEKLSPNPEIGYPFVQSIVNPRAIVSIAKVATNGGTLNLVMVQPLNIPNNAPTIKPPKTAPKSVKPTNKF